MRTRPSRRRPVPSERRRQQKASEESRLPRVADNFNVPVQFDRVWTDEMTYRPKAYNYTTLYRSQIRARCCTGPPAQGGPIDIRDPDDQRTIQLLAEWGSTPGKRLATMVEGYTSEHFFESRSFARFKSCSR